MKKIVSLVMALLMITCCIPVSFAEADMTEYTSFNLWYTPNTHVKKGETISLLVKDGDGNVLNAENADLSFKSQNPAVATVDDEGNVTGVNPGIAVISAKLSNNKTELLEEKIAISVINGNVTLQSFETVEDAAWPTTKPRTGERSYSTSAGNEKSTFSYRNSSGEIVDENKNFWGGANRNISSVWYYDDGSSVNPEGSTVVLQDAAGQSLLTFRTDTAEYYAKGETTIFNPTITETSINERVTRSIGWHQVVFDISKGNMGDGTGERSVYLDGEIIFRQKYTFETYVAPGQICVQAKRANLSGEMFFDDMNGYGITRDYNAKAVVTDLIISQNKNAVSAEYNFYDANESADMSVYTWQISDNEGGEFTDIPGADSSVYALTSADEGKYIRLKLVPNNSDEAVYSNPILATYIAQSTDYTSYNLTFTEKTSVKKGETIALTVKDSEGNTLNGENASLSFKSLNPAVATVDANGNVKGVNPGVAVISAKLLNNKTELPEAKIMITVRTGNEVVQSFEGVADDAWPTTKPRMGTRSYLAGDGSKSSTSYKNSSNTNVTTQYLSWGSAYKPIVEVWFYDDGEPISNATGPAIRINDANNQTSLFSMRMSGTQYYGQSDTGHKTTSNTVIVNKKTDRSIGWHQVVFDMSKANNGDGTGERAIFFDGEMIYHQSYTFDSESYIAPRMSFITSNTANLSGAMYFDDMSVRDVTRDDSAKPVAADVNVMIEGVNATGEYSFYDANGAADASTYQWQVSDSVNGVFKDIEGANAKTYELTGNEVGKYVRLKVTPANPKVLGDAVYSKSQGPVTADLPEALDAAIKVVSLQDDNSAVVGDVVTGKYSYKCLIAEKDSAFRWLYADTEDATEWIAIADGITTAGLNTELALTPAMNGKYIRFEITPKDSNGNMGEKTVSDAIFVNAIKVYTNKDCAITSNEPDKAHDEGWAMISNASDKVRMQIIRFDFGNVSEFESISKVVAKIHVNQATHMAKKNTLSLYPVTTSDWEEDATWNTLREYVDTDTVIGSTVVTKEKTGWYEIDITDYVKEAVKTKTGIDVALWSSDLADGQYIQVACSERAVQATPIMVVASADDMMSGMPLDITSVAYPEADGADAIKTTVHVKNNTLSIVEGKLITALYSGDKLVSVDMEDIELSPNGKLNKASSLKLGEEENYSIIAHVWNSMEGLVPLADVKSTAFKKSELEGTVPASKENFHIYLCIGQSNMAGRAPILEEDINGYDNVYLFNADNAWEEACCGEYNGNLQGFNRYSTTEAPEKVNGISPAHSFAKKIAAENKDVVVGIVSNARGGTSINEWLKGAESGYYEATVARVKEAMKYGTLKGVIWHQGESDQSTADTYISRITTLINDLRTDLDIEKLPFVAGQILPSGTKFNNMIVNLPDAVPYTDYVSSEGTTDIGDGAHFDNASAKLMGERYAEKISAFVYR